MPLFLCLQKESGQTQDASWETDGASLGEYAMHSFGEHPISLYHNGVGESHLSQILEDTSHPKYSLSAKACQGILNQASRRGKELPQILKEALESQSLRGCGGAGYQQGYVLAEAKHSKTEQHTFPQQAYDKFIEDGIGTTLKATGGSYGGGSENLVCIAAVDCRNGTEDSINSALQSVAAHSLNGNNVVRTNYIVRRLTPCECEALQGFPKNWTDIGDWVDSKGKVKKTSDAARYKALGNSIALPPWKWVLKRLCACYERDATMASLFDGIGGFPYIWEQLNGKGSCLWASEIEEFPIAVTKRRFNDGTEST
jgi:site-specific DNA-cytosine methylase